MASWSNSRAQAIAQAVMAEIDNPLGVAVINFYDGTAPATVDDAIGGGNTLLAQLGMADPPFADSPGNVNPGYRITANAISDDSSADATGTPTFCRIIAASGSQVVQLSVSGTGGGGECQIVPATITSGQPVAITSLTLTVPEA